VQIAVQRDFVAVFERQVDLRRVFFDGIEKISSS